MNIDTINQKQGLLRPALSLLVVLTLITGFLYPMLVTGLAQSLFNRQANGGVLSKNNQVVGFSHIGQTFTSPGYLWGRPSAVAYNGQSSGGSNLGPLNPELTKQVEQRIAVLHNIDPTNSHAIPDDLLSTSASGLDPEISPEAAHYQAARIAKVRGLPLELVQGIIDFYTQDKQFGLLGEPRVNVLKVNLALDNGAPL